MKLMKDNKVFFLYAFLLVITGASFLFMNINYDAEYQIAMGYRMMKGDGLITQMWEPHQTSAFLMAILLKIYITITGTTTGIVLYTQVVGLLIRGAISGLIYKAFRRVTDQKPACIAAMLYFLVSPKEVLTPEFGNLQLWFGTLLFLLLVQYFNNYKVRYLAAGAVCLCFGVLSYPSFIITYAAVITLLFLYARKPVADSLIFTGVCAFIGGSFAAYLLITIDIDVIFKCLEHALALEPTHTVNMVTKMINHLIQIGKIAGLLLAVGAVGLVAEFIRRAIRSAKNKNGVKSEPFLKHWFLLSWLVLQVFLLLNILSVSNRGGYAFPFIVILIQGFRKRHLLSEAESRIYISAIWISFMSLIATLILSDNAFLQAVTYMLIMICASVLPLYRWYEQISVTKEVKRLFLLGLHSFLLLIIFRCLFIHIPMYDRSQICSILDDLALIRSGPAIGIVTDEEGAARQRDSMKEWKNYVKEGDTIWILGDPVDTLGYLYEDVEVGAPTVMSTPTYNEYLLYYWELNPDKIPDVIILSSSFGALNWSLQNNEWLMQWLEESYQADEIVDGNYWRYYIKNENN